MLISTLPDEILDLTFRQLVPPFRSEALTEVYVFDTPVHLLRLRLVSKRFCRIATPLAWRRVQLKISGREIAETVLKGRPWSSASSASTSKGVDTMCSKSFDKFPEENINRPSPFSSSYHVISNGRSLNSNPTESHCSPSPSFQFLFFQGHPKLAAHVRVLSLIINVEHQIEEPGSGSGSGPAFEFGSESGLVSASGGFSFAIHGDAESESDSTLAPGSHHFLHRRNSTASSATTAQRSFNASSPSPTWCLKYVLRAITKGMSNLRTVFIWDAAAPTPSSFSTQAEMSPSYATAGGTLAQEVITLFHRSRLIKVLSLRDVDGAAFSAKPDCHNDYPCQLVPGCNPLTLPRSNRQSYQGLKMLHLSNVQHPAQIISSLAAGSTLEVLSLEVVGPTSDDVRNRNDSPELTSTPTLRDLPWSSLKEVSLLHCADDEDWCQFLSGFKSHRCQSLQSPLTELLIGDLSGLDQSYSHQTQGTGSRLTHLLTTFKLQPLTKLTLFTLPHLTPFASSRIVHAFPNLRSLTILTENELAPWQGGTLDDYARILGLLPYLDTLGWNNSHLLQPFSSVDFESNQNLAACYARSVTALVRRAKRLKCVKFISAADGVVDSVFISKRKNRNHFRHPQLVPYEQYEPQIGSGQLEQQRLSLIVKRSHNAALHTSSWDTTSVRFDDI